MFSKPSIRRLALALAFVALAVASPSQAAEPATPHPPVLFELAIDLSRSTARDTGGHRVTSRDLGDFLREQLASVLAPGDWLAISTFSDQAPEARVRLEVQDPAADLPEAVRRFLASKVQFDRPWTRFDVVLAASDAAAALADGRTTVLVVVSDGQTSLRKDDPRGPDVDLVARVGAPRLTPLAYEFLVDAASPTRTLHLIGSPRGDPAQHFATLSDALQAVFPSEPPPAPEPLPAIDEPAPHLDPPAPDPALEPTVTERVGALAAASAMAGIAALLLFRSSRRRPPASVQRLRAVVPEPIPLRPVPMTPPAKPALAQLHVFRPDDPDGQVFPPQLFPIQADCALRFANRRRQGAHFLEPLRHLDEPDAEVGIYVSSDGRRIRARNLSVDAALFVENARFRKPKPVSPDHEIGLVVGDRIAFPPSAPEHLLELQATARSDARVGAASLKSP